MRDLLGLSLAAAPAVSAAPAAPAITWVQYSPSYTVQQEGCGSVSGSTFTLTCSNSGQEYDRAERRYVDYSSGSHRFNGTFKITSMSGSRISLKQTFHDNAGPYFLLAVESGGRLYSVEGGATIALARPSAPRSTWRPSRPWAARNRCTSMDR